MSKSIDERVEDIFWADDEFEIFKAKAQVKSLIAQAEKEARIAEATLFNRYFDDNYAFKGFAEKRLAQLREEQDNEKD